MSPAQSRSISRQRLRSSFAAGVCWLVGVGCSVAHVTEGNSAGAGGTLATSNGGAGATGDGGAAATGGGGSGGLGSGGGGAAGGAQTDGLIAHFRFDEGSGTTAVDAISGLSMSLMGDANWDAAGRFGSALSLDGNGDYAELLAPGTILDFGTVDFTVTAWVKAASFSETDASFEAIAGRGAIGQRGYTLWLRWNDMYKNFLRFGINDGSDSASTPPMFVTPPLFERVDEWVFVAGTRSGTTVNAYVDGQPAGMASNAAVGSIDVRGTMFDVVTVGRNAENPYYYFEGSIDDVRFYARVLEPAELLALAAGD